MVEIAMPIDSSFSSNLGIYMYTCIHAFGSQQPHNLTKGKGKVPPGCEGLDKWLRRQASVLEVHSSNPAMTWLKIISLLSLPYRC